MTERPILFSAAMVRALLAGTKTQTRRALRMQPLDDGGLMCGPYHPTVIRRGEEEPGPETFGAFTEDGSWATKCPYGQPGDQLWVREAWRTMGEHDKSPPRDLTSAAPISYLADDRPIPYIRGKYRPPMFMPRWASRITLEITEVRVQRIQEISESDAWAEGCIRGDLDDNGDPFPAEEKCSVGSRGWDSAQDWYADLWESINGPDSWDANPWVWAISFKRLAP